MYLYNIHLKTKTDGDNMKKLLIFTAIIMMCICMAACVADTTPTEETSTHTLPPTETVANLEPEWAEIDCNIKLINADSQVILSAEDFETFAVVGTNDDDSYIVVKVTDQAIDTVKSSDLSNSTISINDEYSSAISIDTETFEGKIEFGYEWSYDELCLIASSIRGLY